MFGIGAGEFIVILIVGLIVFGPSKLPEIGKALGKALREFRKAQAALSATLNEVEESPKKSPPEKTSATQTVTADASTDNAASPSNMTADDVIKLAKERTLVKESNNEKILSGTADDVPADNARASLAGAGGNSDGSGKQS